MNVLVACEFSGVVRDCFKDKGHYAMSCDLLPTDKPGIHYQGNVFDVLDGSWDLMIAHPPCTYLCNSGVNWLHKQPDRWKKMRDGASFFKQLLDAPLPRKAIENPIMHKYAVEIVGRRQDQLVQPWMFGHPEQKATCLWLKGLPKLTETNNVKEEMMGLPKNERERLHHIGPSPDRWKLRSITFSGLAAAMADQWGGEYDELANNTS